MTTGVLILATALWLGVLTSISPCPLATNVAATSLLARRVGSRRRAMAGAAYAAGRMFAYVSLAVVVFAGLSSMPDLSSALRHWVLPLVGPLLVLTGMAVLGWLPVPFAFSAGSAGTASRLASWGLLGEFFLGSLFALSFCPVSAALFFGSLLPLAMTHALPPLPVVLYGLGTALPVAVLAILLVLSVERAGSMVARMQTLQRVSLRVTGAILIAVGVWLSISQTLGLGG
jgi:threonine/homoserine/homoserine lactone efflux protein